MKVSNLIASATEILATYGDIPVTLTKAIGELDSISSENVFIGVYQREEGFELNLRDFPY